MSRRSSNSAPSESSGGGGGGRARPRSRRCPAWRRDERYLERFAELLAARPLLLRPASRPGLTKKERCGQLEEMARLLPPPTLDAVTMSKRVYSFRCFYFSKLSRIQHDAAGCAAWMRTIAPHVGGGARGAVKRDRAAEVVRALTLEARRLRTLRAEGVCRAEAAARHVRRAALEAAWRQAVRAARRELAALADGGDADGGGVDWLLADTVLLYGARPAATDEHLVRPEPLRALVATFHLVQLFSLEEGEGGSWRAAAAAYRRRGRVASAVLLQRRWHDLKLQVRRRMRAALQEAALAHLLLTPLHVAIAKRFPQVVTDPLPSWRQLVAAGAVYVGEEDEEVEEVPEGAGDVGDKRGAAGDKGGDPVIVDVDWPMGGAAGAAASDEDDLVLIEREIETIDLLLDEDDDSARPAPPLVRVKLEPGAELEDRRAALRARRHDATRALQEELDRQLRDMDAYGGADRSPQKPESPVNAKLGHPIDIETHSSFDVEFDSSIDIAVDCPVEIEASSLADVRFDYPVNVEDNAPVEMQVDTRVDSPGDMQFESIDVESNSPIAVRVDSPVDECISLMDSPTGSPAPLVVDESADGSSSDVEIEEPQFDPKLLMTTAVCLRRVDELPGWSPRDLARLQGGSARDPRDPEGDPRDPEGDPRDPEGDPRDPEGDPAKLLEGLEDHARPRGDERPRKRVRLPDISEVRRNNRRMLTAQVAPLGAAGSGSEGEEEAAPPLAAAELARVLRALAARRRAPPPRPLYCCMARRHRAVNTARQRAAVRAGRAAPAEVPLHAARCGAGGAACACCCRHLLVAGAGAAQRDSLRAHILRALQQEEDEPSPKNSDAEEATPPSTEDTATNERQVIDNINLTSTRKRKVKKKRRPRRSPPRSPPPVPPRDPLQEWIHQKTLTSRFFDLNLKRPPPAPAPVPSPPPRRDPMPAPPPPPSPPAPLEKSILSMLANDYTVITYDPPAPSLPPDAIPVTLRVMPPPAVVDLCASSSDEEAPGAPAVPGAPVLLNECVRPQPTLEVSPMLRCGPNIKVFQISPDGSLTPRPVSSRASPLAPPPPSPLISLGPPPKMRVRATLQARTTTTSTVTTPRSSNSGLLVFSAPNASNIRVRPSLQPRTTTSTETTPSSSNASLVAPSSTSYIRVRGSLQPRTTAPAAITAGPSNASLVAPSAPSTSNIRVRANLQARTTASTVITSGPSKVSLVPLSSLSTVRVRADLQPHTTAYTPIAPRPSKAGPVTPPTTSLNTLSPVARLSKVVLLSGKGPPAGPPRLLNHSLPTLAETSNTLKITEVFTSDGQRRLVVRRGPPARPPAPPPAPLLPPVVPLPSPLEEVSKFSDKKMSVQSWLSRRAADSELRVQCLDSAVPYYIIRQRYYILSGAPLAMARPTYWSAEGPACGCVRLEGAAGVPGGARTRLQCVVRGPRECAALVRAGAALEVVHAPSGVRAPLYVARGAAPRYLALRCNFLTVELALRRELNAIQLEKIPPVLPNPPIASIRIVSTASLASPQVPSSQQETPPQEEAPPQKAPPQEATLPQKKAPPQEETPPQEEAPPQEETPPQEEEAPPRPSRRAARDARAKMNTLMTEEEGGEGSRVVQEYLEAHGAHADDDDDDDYSDRDNNMQHDDDD